MSSNPRLKIPQPTGDYPAFRKEEKKKRAQIIPVILSKFTTLKELN